MMQLLEILRKKFWKLNIKCFSNTHHDYQITQDLHVFLLSFSVACHEDYTFSDLIKIRTIFQVQNTLKQESLSFDDRLTKNLVLPDAILDNLIHITTGSSRTSLDNIYVDKQRVRKVQKKLVSNSIRSIVIYCFCLLLYFLNHTYD